MNEQENVILQMKLRSDLGFLPGRVYVPEDMTNEEIAAKFPAETKAGTVERVSYQGSELDQAAPLVGLAAGPRRLIYSAPPVIQLFPPSSGAKVNTLSPGLVGPTWLRGVMIEDFAAGSTSSLFERVGVHVTSSKSVGYLQGDMDLFQSINTNRYSALGDGSGVTISNLKSATQAGISPANRYEFPMKVFVPFSSFWVNASFLNGTLTDFLVVYVFFEPAEILEGETFGLKSIQPRFAQPPVAAYEAPRTLPGQKPNPAVTQIYNVSLPAPSAPAPSISAKAPTVKAAAAPAPAKSIQTKQYKNYAAIKTDEAAGYKIVWSTLHNTGQGAWGFPLEVQVYGV